jgi:hypothetical protein
VIVIAPQKLRAAARGAQPIPDRQMGRPTPDRGEKPFARNGGGEVRETRHARPRFMQRLRMRKRLAGSCEAVILSRIRPEEFDQRPESVSPEIAAQLASGLHFLVSNLFRSR